MNKIENLVVVNNFSFLGTTSNQGVVYFPDIYNIAHTETSNGVKSAGYIDPDVFLIVSPSYNTVSSNNPTTGSTARFGVKILETGVYRARYSCNVENETFGDRT